MRLEVLLFLVAVCVAASPCAGDVRKDIASLDAAEEKAFRAAVARVAPSVVRLETVGGLERAEGVVFGNGPTTGLIIDDQGYIVSSGFNFLRKPDSILVQLADGSRKAARLLATDHSRKLVLLKIESGGNTVLPAPVFAERKNIRPGQWAIGVGRTFPGNHPNISVGIVSAVNRIWGKAIQTDAAVSPNNYGGPLIDIYGRVMGLLVPMSPEGEGQTAGLELYDSGIGFAVPSDDLLRSIERLKKGDDLFGGFLGIVSKQPNLSMAEAVVEGCAPGSPAQKAGLKTGDRILSVDGRKIDRATDLREAVARRYAGEKIKIEVLRNDQKMPFEIELVPPPAPAKLLKKGRLIQKRIEDQE
ncbi:MAG: PDZ domain-containing protein [Pirellulales bacterium]|nr:PDZ domain-containing protein [Pirellulales bacterium]